MNELSLYRFMKSGEEVEVCNLVIRGFNEFIASHYSEQGVQEFLKYAEPHLLFGGTRADHFVLLAATQDKIAGMIEILNNTYVSLLFVDPSFQRRGIGRELLRRSMAICRGFSPPSHVVTVNASPNSVQIYHKLGFRQICPEQLNNGIRFTPMLLRL